MVEQANRWCEMQFAPALPFKLGKIQTAEVGSIDPAVTPTPAQSTEQQDFLELLAA